MIEIIRQRHSVRQYLDKRIEDSIRDIINQEIKDINEESGLNIQMFYDEPKCFNSIMAHYGKFINVNNYIAIVGNKKDEEKAGYFGERLVLRCQELGLNSCWVALTHGKCKAVINKGEKLLIIIALGYGLNQGVEHKSKAISELSKVDKEEEWFNKGMEAVCLAPTAMNQQKFLFELKDGKVTAKALRGFYSKIDLGIVKYHFEVVSKYEVK